ncbi:hypothetical protein M2S79_27515, partial [Klebsiella pneumoniae]|nr:hypothetical protein [Klebsiella pneumoniae]
TGLFVFAFKKNPVPKGAGFFAVWGISPPVALRLPGLRACRVLSPAPVHHITTGNAPQYHCPCNQTSLPPPDTIN